MKLLELTLTNFRQFYGENKINFSHDVDKNITIIHGNNGSGKTAILNSITWALYESFTNAFQAPNELVNKRAISEALIDDIVTCYVELIFENQGNSYRVKREKKIRKVGDNNETDLLLNSQVELQWSDGTGKWKKANSVNDVIGRILPEQLHRYFFLDGERIEALQKTEKESEVSIATKMFIGEEVLIRAERHLGGHSGAKSKFEEELKRIGDAEINHLIEEKNKLEVEIETKNEQIEQHKNNIIGFNQEKSRIESVLRDQKDVKELQNRRDTLNKQLIDILSSDNNSKISLTEIVSKRAHKVFLLDSVEIFRNIIEDLRNRGELPAAIKKPFVQELLNKGECICKRELLPGEESYNAVQDWLNICGLSDIEEVAIKMGAEVDILERDVPSVFEQIGQEQRRRQSYKEQISKIEKELYDISEELKGNPEEQVRDLERKLEEVNSLIEEQKRQQYIKEEDIKGLKLEVEKLYKEIERRESINDKHELIKRRLSAAIESAKIISDVRERIKEYFRDDLNQRIKRIFSEISFKDYEPVLDDNYSLYLLDEGTGKVGASTGENQILSLSFIGAIIEQAKIYTARKDKLPSPDSSEFPIVLDSPFGNLDPIHRRQVASSIPKLANQVIILVTKTQWQGEVEESTENKIGKEYILEYSSPKENVEEEKLIRRGNAYQLVKKAVDPFESVEIVEVI